MFPTLLGRSSNILKERSKWFDAKILNTKMKTVGKILTLRWRLVNVFLLKCAEGFDISKLLLQFNIL